MFEVNGTEITISKGDTGAIRCRANAKRRDTGEPYVFSERDRALFSIKYSNQIVKQKSYPIVDSKFTVVFFNADTDQLIAGGGYSWDVRYVINPYYDENPPAGPWVDYDELTFPVESGTKCMHGGTYYVANQDIESSEEWTPEHWHFVDFRVPVDGDQVITPKQPMSMQLLNIVGDI